MPSDRSSNSSGAEMNKIISRRAPMSTALAKPDVISATKHEEWTTSKKVVNHKTRQVETRVQRKLVLEDGKVVADSGPQITTKTTEDNKVEETENTEHKKTGDNNREGYIPIPGSERVVSEKTETHQTMKESKEENKKMHDESFHDVTGPEDIHRLALMSTNDSASGAYPGTLTHYSVKSQKVTDKEELKQISENKNGEVTTQTTRTHHHEEAFDDEVPEDEVDCAGLPAIERETKRNFEYLHDDGAKIDHFPDCMQKELLFHRTTPDRQDPVAIEEEIRNSETSRWLEDHFGSDTSDTAEDTRMSAGGNVINIHMTDTPTSPKGSFYSRSHNATRTTPDFVMSPSPREGSRTPLNTSHYMGQENNTMPGRMSGKSNPSLCRDLSKDDEAVFYEERRYKDYDYQRPKASIFENNIFTKEDKKLRENRRFFTTERNVQKQGTFRYEGRSPVQRSQSTRELTKPSLTWTASLPRNLNSARHYSSYYGEIKKPSKGVQADLSDEESPKQTHTLPHRHHHRHHHHSHHHHVTMARPPRTFFFGDKSDVSYHSSKLRDGFFTIERDYVQPRESPLLRSRFYSTEDLSQSRRHNFTDRQRHFPATPPSSPPPRLIKVLNGRSPSPPHSPRPTVPPPPPPPMPDFSKRTSSPVIGLPSFTPLQSPLEIKRHTLPSKNTVVELRGNR